MKNRLTEIIASSRRRGPVYILSEDFEGTGAPSGWTFNGTGTCNYDASAGGPSDQYLFVASTTNSNLGGAQYAFPGGSRSVFGFYCMLFLNFTGVGINRNMWIMDNAFIGFSTGGPYWLNSVAITLPRLTWLHVWIDFTASSRDFFVSSNEIKPSTPTATVASSGTCSRMAVSINHSVGEYIDKIRLSASPIGSNPL